MSAEDYYEKFYYHLSDFAAAGDITGFQKILNRGNIKLERQLDKDLKSFLKGDRSNKEIADYVRDTLGEKLKYVEESIEYEASVLSQNIYIDRGIYTRIGGLLGDVNIAERHSAIVAKTINLLLDDAADKTWEQKMAVALDTFKGASTNVLKDIFTESLRTAEKMAGRKKYGRVVYKRHIAATDACDFCKSMDGHYWTAGDTEADFWKAHDYCRCRYTVESEKESEEMWRDAEKYEAAHITF